MLRKFICTKTHIADVETDKLEEKCDQLREYGWDVEFKNLCHYSRIDGEGMARDIFCGDGATMICPYAGDNTECEKEHKKKAIKPAHYHKNVIPLIEIICSYYCGADCFYMGNIIKYLCRAPFKGKTTDIEKALEYLEMFRNSGLTNMREMSCDEHDKSIELIKDIIIDLDAKGYKRYKIYFLHAIKCILDVAYYLPSTLDVVYGKNRYEYVLNQLKSCIKEGVLND